MENLHPEIISGVFFHCQSIQIHIVDFINKQNQYPNTSYEYIGYAEEVIVEP